MYSSTKTGYIKESHKELYIIYCNFIVIHDELVTLYYKSFMYRQNVLELLIPTMNLYSTYTAWFCFLMQANLKPGQSLFL